MVLKLRITGVNRGLPCEIATGRLLGGDFNKLPHFVVYKNKFYGK